jgi:hypothetical protein
VEWLRKKDDALIDRFIEHDIASDQTLLREILEFCALCETVSGLLDWPRVEAIRMNVEFLRRKWVLRVSFYTGPLPSIAPQDLPTDLRRELNELGMSRRHDGPVFRLSFRDDTIRHIAYRIFSSSRSAVGPVEELLSILSSAARDTGFSGYELEIGMAGYGGDPKSGTAPWTWKFRVRSAAHEQVVLYVSDEELPLDVREALWRIVIAEEQKVA